MKSAAPSTPSEKRLAHSALEAEKPPESGSPAFRSNYARSGDEARARPICSPNGSAPSRRRPRGELRFTHQVLDSSLSPLAKATTAAVERLGSRFISLDQFETILPARRGAIVAAIREAEAAGYLHVNRPRRCPPFADANHYTLSADANPRSGIRPGFTRVLLDRDYGKGAKRLILRAVYEREQARAGAIQLPDSIAGRPAGMSEKAVRLARAAWKNSLVEVRRGRKTAPGILILTDGPYLVDLDRFKPDLYRVKTLQLADTSFALWRTDAQAKLLAALNTHLPVDAAALASLLADEPEPIPADRVFCLSGTLRGGVFCLSGELNTIYKNLRSTRTMTAASRLSVSEEAEIQDFAASLSAHPRDCDCLNCSELRALSAFP